MQGGESNECIICTPDGVQQGQGCQVGRDEERLSGDVLDKFRGAPWEPVPGSGSCTLKVKVEVPMPRTEIPGPLSGETPNLITRRSRITRRDFGKMRYTPLCQGCRCLARELPSQNHNEKGRARVEEYLTNIGDAKVTRSWARMSEGTNRGEETRVKRQSADDEMPEIDWDQNKEKEEKESPVKVRRTQDERQQDVPVNEGQDQSQERPEKRRRIMALLMCKKEIEFKEEVNDDKENLEVVTEWNDQDHEEIITKTEEKGV